MKILLAYSYTQIHRDSFNFAQDNQVFLLFILLHSIIMYLLPLDLFLSLKMSQLKGSDYHSFESIDIRIIPSEVIIINSVLPRFGVNCLSCKFHFFNERHFYPPHRRVCKILYINSKDSCKRMILLMINLSSRLCIFSSSFFEKI